MVESIYNRGMILKFVCHGLPFLSSLHFCIIFVCDISKIIFSKDCMLLAFKEIRD